jgi:hypothetical protein
VLALIVAPSLSSSAYATAKEPNEKFSTDCENEKSGKEREGDCPGQSEKSGPHDEVVENPAGKDVPGLSEDDD